MPAHILLLYCAHAQGTAVGLYCGGKGCLPDLECIGVVTSDDADLVKVQDHGVRLKMPSNLTGMRDPARPFLADNGTKLCAIFGAGAHDCENGGAKYVQYCTPDLVDMNNWTYRSTVASVFTRSKAPSGGENRMQHDDGCNGLVSCPDFFPLPGDDNDLWMLMGNYNNEQSSWYPASQYAVGTFDGLKLVAQQHGQVGSAYDYVPKSGAGSSNTGRRLFWTNVGVSLNGHTGFLSLSREFTVADAGIGAARGASPPPALAAPPPTLEMQFVNELHNLRIPDAGVRVQHAATTATGNDEHASGANAAVSPLHRVGDTALVNGMNARQVEIRATFTSIPPGSTDAYGIAVLTSTSADGAYLLESTRIGYSPFRRHLFVDRTYSSLIADGGWPAQGYAPSPTSNSLLYERPFHSLRFFKLEKILLRSSSRSSAR